MQRRLIGIATGEIKRRGKGHVGGKQNNKPEPETKAMQLSLSSLSEKKQTKLYLISWKGGEQTFFFFVFFILFPPKCSTHMPQKQP